MSKFDMDGQGFPVMIGCDRYTIASWPPSRTNCGVTGMDGAMPVALVSWNQLDPDVSAGSCTDRWPVRDDARIASCPFGNGDSHHTSERV